jgi:DNA-binding transcriptional regulator YhcF (GntR family)
MDAEPIIRIDLFSPIPAYRQIVDAVRAILVAGGIKPGEHLPTVRQLAVDLGVHHNTVAEAYRILAEEGWLDLTRRRGATVLGRAPVKASPEEEQRFITRLKALIAEARAAGVSLDVIASELRELSKHT